MRADEDRQRVFYCQSIAGFPVKPAIFCKGDYAMSRTDPRAKFDYQSWFNRHVAERTKAALEARDAAFAVKHAETPLPELARYLARQAQTLRHTPSPCEVDGGAFIAQRFGGWDAALRLAKLPPPKGEAKLTNTARYRKEKAVQEPLTYAETEQCKK